ncbi:MAG: pilus assembly protein PilM [Deltaproteobacteria bacterium]|nr:pilus assembly protein PilM [Deltaproteobacteria bacterium]
MVKRRQKSGLGDGTRESRVAIDIGLYSIKCAFFRDHLLHLEEFPLFDQPRDFRTLKEQELSSLQMSAINKAVTMINPKGEFILSPPPSPHVLTRILLPPADLDLRRHLEKEFPFEPDQLGYDIHTLNAQPKDKRSRKEDEKVRRIVVSATDQDFIRRSIGLLGEFQLQIRRLTPCQVALLNYLILASDVNAGTPIVFLDLGSLYSQIIIFKEKDRFLARTLMQGGSLFNQELAEKLNVDFETAERIKRERKLIDDGLFDSRAAASSMPMFQAVNSVLFALVDEIRHSMTYFEDSFMEDLSGASLLLAGGASGMHNLDRFLHRELDLRVLRVEDPVHNVHPGNSFAPQFASVIGLLGDPSHPGLLGINLINNVEGMLFKIQDTEYYLTKAGFVNKKKYPKRRRGKRVQPLVTLKGGIGDEPGLGPVAFLQALNRKAKALFRGERFEMPKLDISFGRMDVGSVRNWVKPALLVLGAFFLVAMVVDHFFWASKKTALEREIRRYVGKRDEVQRARAAFLGGPGYPAETKGPTVSRQDKIIWSSKLRAVASAVPESVWISDLVIQGKPLALVLTCHVSSYAEDHLRDIAFFIEKLKTNQVFMKDFTDVLFRSARRSRTSNDVYDFTLTFPMKRKPVEEISEPLKAQG